MITTPQEYYKLLYKIQSENAPSLAVLLPSTEKIYNINLETRTIEAPEFLSVNTDHRSEIIYFKVPRYYDSVDLSTTACVIQYVNAAGEERVYAVPFFDVDTYSSCDPDEGIEDPMMLFPWVIEGDATKKAGIIKYAVRFFKLDSSARYLLYNLNTLEASSKILHGQDWDIESDISQSGELQNYLATCLEDVISYAKLASERDLYWDVL